MQMANRGSTANATVLSAFAQSIANPPLNLDTIDNNPPTKGSGVTDVRIYRVALQYGENGLHVVTGSAGTACATPSFGPAAPYSGPATSVTISTTTGGASINYTTDGSAPTPTHGTPYTGPVNITATCTLQAIAYEAGYNNSSVASGTYTINLTNFFTTAYSGTRNNTDQSLGYEFTRHKPLPSPRWDARFPAA